MHVRSTFVGCLSALAVVALAPRTLAAAVDTQSLDLNGETAYMNFIKVLAGILITTPEPPHKITNAVKVVMRDLMNEEPAKQGYFSYLTTTVLRVYNSPLKVQVDNMFNIIVMMSEGSPTAKASKVVQDFMLSPEGFIVYADIEKYVNNLFQPIVGTPGKGGPSFSLNLDSLQRPANSGRPASRQPL